MTCPACRHENRDGAKFCDACGARLPRRCPACGHELRDAARFCDECGHSLAAGSTAASPPATLSEVADRLARRVPAYTPRHLAEKILTSRAALEGERKIVTVLFADCAGFTELSTRLDPEDLHGVMDGCFQQLLEAVHRYEGTVNQFTGDGVMALFGAPIAHEDHPLRAVAAAVAIQRAAREYGERVRRERGLSFAMRLGLNTGPVVVGKIGDDLRMDYTAQGETVNLAARLQQAAPPGGILISDATHRLVEGHFHIEEREPLALKGLDRPVRAYLVHDRRRRGRFDIAVERGLTPLAGRAAELAFLHDAVARACGGRGQVVSLVGDAGVGKSRLAWELRAAARDRQCAYVEAHVSPHADALPFDVVAQLVRALLGSDDIARAVDAIDPSLAWVVPYVANLLGVSATLDADGLDQAQRRRRMIDAAKSLVLAVATRRPLLVVIEDLQWIDHSSEEALGALVDALAGRPITIISTYRPGYGPPWQDRSIHRRLTVDPLGEAEMQAMAAALLPRELGPMASAVVERAAGNPLFLEELVRYLREQLTATGTGGIDTGDIAVPESIHDLLTARIDRLPARLKRTLQLAAVLGRDFSLSLLEALAPAGEDVATEVLELVRLELLREREPFPDPSYSFAHLMTQKVAYDALLIRARAELHGRAAAALEARYGERADDVLPQLTEHYARSPDRAKALEYLVRAGDRAASLFAYEDADGYYRRALATIGRGPDEAGDRAVVLDRLGEAAFARGAVGEARARWIDALSLGVNDPRQTADLHRKAGAAAWSAADRDDALTHLERGLSVLADDLESREAARIYQELARIHVRLGDEERAKTLAERARGLGERLGAADVVADADNTWGVAVARGGDLEGGAQHLERSLATATGHGLGTVACRAYVNLAVMFAPLDRERALGYARNGLHLARRIGDQLQQSWLHCALASGQCTLNGDFDEGVRAAEAAIELDERLGQRNHLCVPLIILAQVYQCRGDHERAEQYYRRALALAEAVGEPQFVVPCYDGLATLAIERGDEMDADAWLARCRKVQEATGWTSDTFLVLPFLY